MNFKSATIVTAILFTMSFVAPPARALSRAMQFNCETVAEYHGPTTEKPGDLNADDAWVASKLNAFVPRPGDNSLRLLSLAEIAVQVSSAKQTIRATCHDYRTGQMSRELADQILSSSEDVIRNFEEHLRKDSLVQASRGLATDIPAIRAQLSVVASEGRQNSLLGEDLLADAAWHMMTETVRVFDIAFVATCADQVFEQSLPFQLDVQAQILGIEVDFAPCERRIDEARYDGVGSSIVWRRCGALSGASQWKLELRGRILVGDGIGTTESDGPGDYSALVTQWSKEKAHLEEIGTLKMHCIPNDDCACVDDPASETCKARYASTAMPRRVLSARTTSTSGVVYWQKPSGPKKEIIPVLGNSDYPIKTKTYDKPCTDQDVWH